jgi:hypothetical protein
MQQEIWPNVVKKDFFGALLAHDWPFRRTLIFWSLSEGDEF